MMENDNPASRLRILLAEARTIDQNISSHQAWEKLLRAEGNPALLLSRLGKAIALPEEIATTLANSLDASPEVVRHISNQFFAAFSAHKFGERWEVFAARIDDHMMNYLSLASMLLEARTKTKRLDDGDLVQLRESFVQMLEKVRASELSPRIKSYVVLQLHDLISALDDYFITGAGPILERIEATVGHAIIDPEYKGFLQNDKLGKSLLDCLGAAANLVAVGVGIPQLAQIVLSLQHGG